MRRAAPTDYATFGDDLLRGCVMRRHVVHRYVCAILSNYVIFLRRSGLNSSKDVFEGSGGGDRDPWQHLCYRKCSQLNTLQSRKSELFKSARSAPSTSA